MLCLPLTPQPLLQTPTPPGLSTVVLLPGNRAVSEQVTAHVELSHPAGMSSPGLFEGTCVLPRQPCLLGKLGVSLWGGQPSPGMAQVLMAPDGPHPAVQHGLSVSPLGGLCVAHAWPRSPRQVLQVQVFCL